MTESYITAVGTAVPKNTAPQPIITNLIADAMQLDRKQRKTFQWICDRTAIERRYSVLEGFTSTEASATKLALNSSTTIRMQLFEKHAKDLGLEAVKDAITHDQQQAVTHLITVSCTGMYAPGLGIEIIHALGLSQSVERVAINFMGCYALFPALRMANSICRADSNAKVLVVCVELCTLHLQDKFTKDNLLANALFSDGAAALLVEGKKQQVSLCLKQFYCNLIRDDDMNMAWHIRNHGFDIKLSSYVPKLLDQGIPKLLTELQKKLDTQIDDIDYYAIHPGGKSILSTIEKCLGFDPQFNQISHDILRNFGNMSSVTLSFVLKGIFDKLRNGSTINNILMMAFGPGLTLETALLTVTK